MCYGSTTSRVVFVLLYLHRTFCVRCKQAAKPKQLECKAMYRPVSTFIFLFSVKIYDHSVKIYDHSVKIFEILQKCHFPYISGASSSMGTAPLTGERAQRDFPRPSSWTLRHVGIRQRLGTGTPSWTFGQGGFCHRSPTRPSSSLRLDPRRQSDLVP